MKKAILIIGAVFLLMAQARAEETIRYFRDVILYPEQSQEDVKLYGKLAARGYSETEILDQIQKRYFYKIPVLTNEVQDYRFGVVKVRDDGTNTVIVEPVTGFMIRLEYSVSTNGRKIGKKTILHFGEEVDRVEYQYRNGKLVSVSSKLYGQIRFKN